MSKKTTDDEIVATWLKGETFVADDEEKKVEEKVEEKVVEKVEDTPPPFNGPISERIKMAEAARAEGKAGDKVVEDKVVEKRKFEFKRPVKKEVAPVVAPVAAPVVAPAVEEKPAGPLSEDELKGVGDLPSEHKDAVEFWLEAEGVDDAHKGNAKKYLDYAKGYVAKVAELKADDEDFDAANSPELASWIRQQDRPNASRGEMRRIDKMVITRDLKGESEVRDADRNRQIKAIEQKPKIEAKVEAFASDLLGASVPEDILKVLQEGAGDDSDTSKGLEAVADQFGDEVATLIADTHADTVANVEAYLNVTRGVEGFNGNNAHHNAASDAVVRMGQQVLTNPKLAHLKEKGGKTFVPREKFFAQSAEVQARSYTLTDDDVLSYMTAIGKTRIMSEVDAAKTRETERWDRRAKKRGVAVGANAGSTGRQQADPAPSRMPAPAQQKAKTSAVKDFFVPQAPR
jgi:hypothetical protein